MTYVYMTSWVKMNFGRRACFGQRGLRPSSRWHSSNAAKLVSHVRRSTEKLTGQTEVASAQAQVRGKRNELMTWRQSVSDATARYEEVQHKLRHVYAMKTQLYQAQRRDLAALQAVNTEEEELLAEEQSVTEHLDSTKKKERECFEALGNSILDSHEKERAQSERMKYYSRLGSILGAVFGFLGSNMFLRREVRRHQKLQETKMESFEILLKEFHAPNLADITQALSSSDVRVRQALCEQNERQLDEIRQLVLASKTMSDVHVDDSMFVAPQSTYVVTGLGICVLSYAVCMGSYLLLCR